MRAAGSSFSLPGDLRIDGVASNAVIRSMPHSPAIQVFPKTVKVDADRRDDTRPVMTTRRSVAMLP